MTLFFLLLAAGLIVVVLVLGGAFPFWRRDPHADAGAALRDLLLARADGRIDADEFERRQAALHARLLDTSRAARPALRRHLIWAAPACIAAIGGALYGSLETPSGTTVSAPPAASSQPLQNAQANSGGDLNAMARRLAEKMARDPANGEGWLLLARTHGELRQYREAAEAYAKADALLQPDAALLADWADAYVMSREGKWDDKARGIVKKALAAEPTHIKSLALAGSASFDRADYKAAIAYWKRMKARAPADSMDAKLAEANIAEAAALMNGKQPADLPREGAPVAKDIKGTVALDPKLKAGVAPTDTVFVVAKAPDGKGFPLAVKRFTASELPARFSLGDGDAMKPGHTLSKFGEALLSARVSRSGNAAPQPGDITSDNLRVNAGTADVRLSLRERI